jgi:Fic family protein
MAISDLLQRIDDYAAMIRAYRPLSEAEVKELDAYYRIGMTYSSNALEGNSLTLSETKVLLEDGITVGASPSGIVTRRQATPGPTTICSH